MSFLVSNFSALAPALLQTFSFIKLEVTPPSTS